MTEADRDYYDIHQLLEVVQKFIGNPE